MLISDTIERYLDDAATGSSFTRRTYRTAMNRFQEYLIVKRVAPDVSEVERLDVDRLLGFATWLLDEAGIGQRTLHTYLAGLVGWVNFLQVRGWLPFTPQELARFQEGIKRVRRNQRPPDLLPHPPRQEEMQALVDAARETPLRRENDQREMLAKLRDVAIVEVLRCTGLRVGEMVKISRKQLDDEEQASWVVGKRGKVRRVYFDDRAWGAMRRYLLERQALDGSSGRPIADLPLFARHDRRASDRVLPLTTESVQNIIRRLAERADLAAKGITPHALRHYFATRIYQTTHDLAVTQTALGHSNPNTTRIYAKLEDNAVRDAHRRAFD
ncbi:MAG: tyrosine-type recombinase/integrase [Caldilineaceae bacterium]|nr:tyrosine-type recombinase/integrase [Caldilineaceae bacterium]HRJ43525.1 tyrosine-type recombinase/integrase [Caldilineaceae bacterium]